MESAVCCKNNNMELILTITVQVILKHINKLRLPNQ